MNAKTITLKSLTKTNVREVTDRIVATIDYLKLKGCSKCLKADIELVVWEVLCNILDHGNLTRVTKINVGIIETEDCIELIWNPYSVGFNWSSAKYQSNPSWESNGGRGLLIVQQICEFVCEDAGRIAKAKFNICSY